jgi:hypothetical protein
MLDITRAFCYNYIIEKYEVKHNVRNFKKDQPARAGYI